MNGSSGNEETKDDFLGVIVELIDHVRSFTIDSFKNFPLQDEEEEAFVNSFKDEEDDGMSSSVNVKKDLTDWQERHAVLVLSKSKELSQLRFKLCLRLLKEHQFWRIYFQLVRKLVTKYEVLAIQQAHMRRMVMEDDGKDRENNESMYEDECGGYTLNDLAEFHEESGNAQVDYTYSTDMPSNLTNMMANRSHVRNQIKHEQLKTDLVEHIWQKFGINYYQNL